MRSSGIHSFFSSDAVDSKKSGCENIEYKSTPSSRQASQAAGPQERPARTVQFQSDRSEPPGDSEFEIKRIGKISREPRPRPADALSPTVQLHKSQTESLVTTALPPLSLEDSSLPRPAALIKAQTPGEGRPKSQASLAEDHGWADAPRTAALLRPTDLDSAAQTLEARAGPKLRAQPRRRAPPEAGTASSGTGLPPFSNSNQSIFLAPLRQASLTKSSQQPRAPLQQTPPVSRWPVLRRPSLHLAALQILFIYRHGVDTAHV